jgi:O-antigen/teichoic acid export membrane protein
MLLTQGLLQVLGRFLPTMVGFALTMALTHLLEPAEFGVYGLGTALAQLLATGLFAWLGLAALRLIAGRGLDATLLSAIHAVFATMSLPLLLAAIVIWAVPLGLAHPAAIAAAVAGGVVLGQIDLKGAIYTATMRAGASLRLNALRAALTAILCLVLARYGGGGTAVLVASIVATLAASMFFKPAKAPWRLGWNGEPGLLRDLLGFGLPLAASMCLFSIAAWADRVVLTLNAGTAAVGLYTAAIVLVQNTLQMTARAIGAVGLPLAVAAHERGEPGSLDRQLEQNLVVLLGFLLPAGVGLSMLAPNIGATLLGPAYRDSLVELTPILVSASLLSSIEGNYLDHAFHLRKKTWHFIPIASIAATVSIAGLLLLIPRYGILGAAVANLGTALATFIYAIVASRFVQLLPLPLHDIAKLGLATIAMAAVIQPIASWQGGAALALQVAVGAASYALALVALNLMNLRRILGDAVLLRLSARQGRG